MNKKLTVEEHLLLAQHLHHIGKEITGIRHVISGRGLVGKVGQRVFAVDNKLRELKCALDSLMFRDHPDDARTRPDVYFGSHCPGDQE
jgi:hypothetical protein